jgi:hypothetical protein
MLPKHRGYGHLRLHKSVSDITASFATAGLALIPCKLETADLKVSVKVISGTTKKVRIEGCIKHLTDPSVLANFQKLLNHLHYIFHGEDARPLREFAIGASGRGVTIVVRALLESEGFNTSGQYLGIYSGRLYHNGGI